MAQEAHIYQQFQLELGAALRKAIANVRIKEVTWFTITPVPLMCLSNNSDTVMSKNTNVKGEARSNLSPKCSVQVLNERGKK